MPDPRRVRQERPHRVRIGALPGRSPARPRSSRGRAPPAPADVCCADEGRARSPGRRAAARERVAGRAPPARHRPQRGSPVRCRWGRAQSGTESHVVKSANRTVITTVRPCWPAARSRAATPTASRSSSRRMTTGSSTSWLNVRCDPTDRSAGSMCAPTGWVTRPQLMSTRWRACAGPKARTRVARGTRARSPTVVKPRWRRRDSVCSPTPHNAPTGSGCRNATTRSGGTSSNPSGLPWAEAILASEVVAAPPTVQAMPCSSATRARMSSATARGPPRRRRAPRTSRKASSSDTGSTSGVTDRKISITPRDTSR